jgi:hypothetical protein
MRRSPAGGLVVQSATAIFLVAAQALAAAKSPTPTAAPTIPAPSLEIPANVLAQEAPSRAAFNAAEQARAKVLEEGLSTSLSINEVNYRLSGEATGVAFVVLLAYVRLLQKEAQDDQKFALAAAQETFAKSKKKQMEEEKAKAAAMKLAATERFNGAMSAASIEKSVGLVACAAAAAYSLTLPRKPEPTLTPTPSPARPTPTRTPTPKKTPRKAKLPG